MKTVIKGIEAIKEGADIIKAGGIVAFPTETVYGLGCDALNSDAIKKIFKAKGRPQDNPLIVHFSSIKDMDKIAYVTEEALQLFKIFVPGPLTIVLKKKSILPKEISAGLDTVAVRIPKHYIARKLIEQAGTPIAAPSANTSSRISPTTAQHVFEDMENKVPLIIDGGDCEVGIESTVIDLTTDIPTVLRPGAITLEMLLEYLPKIKNHTGEIKVASSPGMKYKHYAPIIDCVMARNAESACKEYDNATQNGKKVVIIGRNGYIKNDKINFMPLGESSQEIAKNLYKSLRDAEKLFELIIIEEFSNKDLEFSIMNRLNKSTQGVII